MNTPTLYMNQIKQMFSEMKTMKDFAHLLSVAKDIYYGKSTPKITDKKLYYLSQPKYNKGRYRQFSILKKSGGKRIINAPSKDLKEVLQIINFVLQHVLESHKSATGFVLGKSIVDNAKAHVGKNYVYNIDLKDFFHSFDKNRVKVGLIYALKKNNIKIEEPIAYLIASLCTHPLEINGDVKSVLPQGSPTSPTLTNILCVRLDRRLNGLAKRFNATYSRYADDITFSSDHNIYTNKIFITELERIISADNKYEFAQKTIRLGPDLKINEKKTRLQKNYGYRQEVTGLVVNKKVNVRRRYIKTIRMWLYQWERYGYKKAQENFQHDYLKDKGHVKHKNASLDRILEGKLLFLKMVKGENDSTYQKLNSRFEKLTYEKDTIDEILDIWQKDGIDNAMHFAYKKKQNLELGSQKPQGKVNIFDLL